jgi:hypothetical protein
MSAGSTYLITRSLFLRTLGVIYLIAFASLLIQIKGLIGSQGILPAEDFLNVLRPNLGSERFTLLPSLFWFTGTSDTALQLVCVSGIAAAILLIAGLAPLPLLIILWVLYLSLFNVSRDFLSFQWDTLLLETGFLAIFLAPTNLLTSLKESPLSPLALLLLWWLLFRFMVESGIVKIVSGDPTWKNLTALEYHYWSQPLPTWTSWFVHHLPPLFHRLSVLLMYGVELFLPFLIFFDRPWRQIAFAGITSLMLIITATGNYNFFTLLTIALASLLLDDAAWTVLLPESLAMKFTSVTPTAPLPLPLLTITSLVALVYLLVSSSQLLQTMDYRLQPPRFLRHLEAWLDPLRSINAYGLFRVMTTSRPEIIIEGSNDGSSWYPYEFKYKPGDLRRPPPFVEPHQPRLDWQMWFAALSRYERTPWFHNFLVRLLEGSPDVLKLLQYNPFPDQPPRFVRALLYHYEFTTSAERRESGAWWKRRLLGAYSPILSLPEPPARGN